MPNELVSPFKPRRPKPKKAARKNPCPESDPCICPAPALISLPGLSTTVGVQNVDEFLEILDLYPDAEVLNPQALSLE